MGRSLRSPADGRPSDDRDRGGGASSNSRSLCHRLDPRPGAGWRRGQAKRPARLQRVRRRRALRCGRSCRAGEGRPARSRSWRVQAVAEAGAVGREWQLRDPRSRQEPVCRLRAPESGQHHGQARTDGCPRAPESGSLGVRGARRSVRTYTSMWPTPTTRWPPRAGPSSSTGSTSSAPTARLMGCSQESPGLRSRPTDPPSAGASTRRLSAFFGSSSGSASHRHQPSGCNSCSMVGINSLIVGWMWTAREIVV